jgi:hypothetical protein
MTWPEIVATCPYLQQLIDCLKPVVGDAYHLLLFGLRRKAEAKAKAKELLTMAGAMTEVQQLAPHASVGYHEGQVSIAMPGQQPSDLAIPPAVAMRLNLDQRRYDALADVVAEAGVELKDETSFPEKRPSEEVIARLVEYAGQATNQTMQEVWGRILAGEIRNPGAFSLRTLNVVSNLNQGEAKRFEAVAKHVVLWHFVAFVPELPTNEYLRSRNIGFGTFRFLADSGLTNETSTSLNLVFPGQDQSLFDYGRGRGILVEQKSPPITVSQNCLTLTTAGAQLVSLVEREADPKNMQILIDIMMRHGMEPEIGSWTKEGNNVKFTPDDQLEQNQ